MDGIILVIGDQLAGMKAINNAPAVSEYPIREGCRWDFSIFYSIPIYLIIFVTLVLAFNL